MNFVKKLVNIVFLIGILPSLNGADAPPTSCVEEQILDLFTKWRQGEKLFLALPPLQTISLQSFEGQYSGYGIKINFSTGNMNLTGLKNLSVKQLRASTDDLFTASGTINFPSLAITSDNYNLKGSAYVFYSLRGSGFMNVTFENVNLKFGINLGRNTNGVTESIQIDDIRVNYNVQAIYVNLENASWPLNKVLNAEAISIVESYHEVLVNEATNGLRSSFNMYLGTMRPDELKNAFVTDC